jgi:prolyl-tRNA synthetase
MLLPVAIPEKNIKKEKEHVSGFAPELFWITQAGADSLPERWYLRPTGESQIYPMYSLWVRSHRDLPFKRYQSRINVYRYEKTTRPFIRGREFTFFETHAVYPDLNGVLSQVKKDMQTTKKVIQDELCIAHLFFKRPQWDKFAGAVDTYAADTLVNGKTNQIASTHNLGQKFSKAYNVKFTDKKEKEQLGWITCYGPGLWRIMAALIGEHADNYGLVLPFDISPTQIVIVPILFGDKRDKKVTKKCQALEKKLKDSGYRVVFDNSDNTSGWKYNKWEMLGVPIRVEIGPKEAESSKVTIVKRTEKKKIFTTEKQLLSTINKLSKEIKEELLKKSKSNLRKNIREAKTLKDIHKTLDTKRGFVRAPFCSVDKDGEKCADILQKETYGGLVRGTLFGKQEKAAGKCVICKKKAKHIVYIAKSY